MEARAKVTREDLCEDARYILANVLAEARFGRDSGYEDIRRACEGAVRIPFAEYVTFLEKAGYLQQDRDSDSLAVTPDGEVVANGGSLAEFNERVVAHFKRLRQSRQVPASMLGTNSGVVPTAAAAATGPTTGSGPVRAPDREPRREAARVQSSGGRSSAVVGGEIGAAGGSDARYERLATIGAGGIGTVYRARQVALGREVALKELRELFVLFGEDQRPELVRRFAEVVRAAAGLAHPNILPIHDVDLDRDCPCVVTELAPNGSARRLIADAEEIPVELTLRYLLQTLHALRAAHVQQVFHRGLKPEQLLLDGYGNVLVSDFGLARIVERDATVIRQVYVGMGNVAYLAPELYTDPAAAGPQADIYALGIIFYELLTRKLPGRRSPMPSQVNPTLPKGIDDVFDRMTRDARDERYASVDDILEDLHKLDGLGRLLDGHASVRLDNPLAALRFRADAEADPGSPAGEVEDEDTGARSPGYRPYSFQQRRRKP
jgi:hypothetical protein